MKVYLLWEENPMFQGTILLCVYSTKEMAEQDAKKLLDSLSADEKPEFDDYGLMAGVNYIIEERVVI